VTWLLWRQHRAQLAITAVALTALSVLLITSGIHIAAVYRAALAACAPSGSCDDLGPQVFAGQGFFFDVVSLTLAVPALVGVFWGAPLVAREFDASTHLLAWTQTVSRRRWLAAKMAWAVIAAVTAGAVLAVLVTWWSGPENAIDRTRFYPGQFDLQGIVPVAYSLFAVALGMAAGTVLRRTVPALAVTVAGFVGVRLALTEFARQHLITAVTSALPAGPHPALLQQNGWTLSAHTILQGGHPVSHLTLPAACHGKARLACLAASGVRQVIIYQPGSRYWAFQGIESAVYLLLAAGLIALSLHLIPRRDA
jgi:hypothetical protein